VLSLILRENTQSMGYPWFLFWLEDSYGGDSIVPGVIALETELAQVCYRAGDELGASAEVAIVEDLHANAAKSLDGRDVVAKVSRECGQTITGTHAETIAAEILTGKEAGSRTRKGAVVPGRVPAVVLWAVYPGVILRRWRITAALRGKRYNKE